MKKEKIMKKLVKEIKDVIFEHTCRIEERIDNIRSSKCRTVGNAEKGLEQIKELEKIKKYIDSVVVFTPEELESAYKMYRIPQY